MRASCLFHVFFFVDKHKKIDGVGAVPSTRASTTLFALRVTSIWKHWYRVDEYNLW